jgi:hypothetical protein
LLLGSVQDLPLGAVSYEVARVYDCCCSSSDLFSDVLDVERCGYAMKQYMCRVKRVFKLNAPDHTPVGSLNKFVLADVSYRQLSEL